MKALLTVRAFCGEAAAAPAAATGGGPRAITGERAALAPDREPAPCRSSFAQQRLWFLDQLAPGNRLLQHRSRLRLTGPLDVVRARAKPERGRARHEALRTTFAVGGRQPVQVIAPAAPLALPVSRPVAGCRRRARGRGAAAGARRRPAPFDLARGPLLRAACCAWRGGARAAADACTTSSPTAGRWACWSASWRRSTRRTPRRPAVAAAGAADPVCRLRASGSATGCRRGARGAARLLAAAARGTLPRRWRCPTDRPRPAVQSYEARGHAATLRAAG